MTVGQGPVFGSLLSVASQAKMMRAEEGRGGWVCPMQARICYFASLQDGLCCCIGFSASCWTERARRPNGKIRNVNQVGKKPKGGVVLTW